MLYPILTVVCLLLRGHSNLQRKDTNVETDSNKSSNGINTSINSCTVEELSKLLTNKIAVSKAIELAAAQQSKTENQFVRNILHLAVSKPIKSDSDQQNQVLLSQDNELQSIIGNVDSPQIAVNRQNYHSILTNSIKSKAHLPTSIPRIGSTNERRQFRERNSWPFHDSSQLLLPHRSLRPPPGANIKLAFRDKIREVTINVSPLMSISEALKQAEIKFQRDLKLPVEDELISFWPSPALGCIIVDRVSRVESSETMMWKISVINENGQVEYEDFCLPPKEEIFIKPGSTIELVYTSVKMVKDLN